MTEDFLQRLPYCLRSYVEGKQWGEFRDVQTKAFEVLFNSDKHLLISSGTSSGKTEAAMFPVIADIFKTKPKRISALYVSPLIALIDDQHDRVSGMLRDSEIQLHSWHGDIPYQYKSKVMSSGKGILQITPESLDTIVTRHYQKAKEMFCDLKYVIIDEIHSFMNSDRGLHLLCELETIEKLAGCKPRRIGLSATLSDFSSAKEWLKANSDKDVEVIQCDSTPSYELKISFDRYAPKDNKEERQLSLRKHYERMYEDSNGCNCLIFANNRGSVENVVVSLKKIGAERGKKKEIWAHHSSVSKDYRKIAEEKIKDPSIKCTAVATSTLELGIDVGDLDRIIHINAPNSVSSMVQKIGRSGRRNGKCVMYCYCDNKYPSRIEGIEFDLVKAIAEAELFLKEKWIEPVNYSKRPYGLLFQQTLGYVKSRITATSVELKKNVFSLYPFRNMEKRDYDALLKYMCEKNVLEYNIRNNSFCLGKIGDSITAHSDFGSNFSTVKELMVYHDKKPVGSIQTVPAIGEIIQLAGNPWEVVSVNEKEPSANVVPATKVAETHWKSGKYPTHTKVMKKMYEVLCSDEIYSYLDESAVAELNSSRMMFREKGMDSFSVGDENGSTIYPWLGTVQFDTLLRILKQLDLVDFCHYPYAIYLKGNYSLDDALDEAAAFVGSHDPSDLVTEEDLISSPIFGKYGRYIPRELLIKQFCEDGIDFGFLE